MKTWTAQQRREWGEDGYIVVRGVVDQETIGRIREFIVDFIERPVDSKEYQQQELEGAALSGDPAVQGAARIRKLAQRGRRTVEIWTGFLASPGILNYARDLLGDDIVLKFDSVFTKPAKVGGATPWHQDIALWRDDDDGAFNAWMAIDAATKENGCLQFVPGSHKGPIVPHKSYEDGIHPELPREQLKDISPAHVELQPGDAVFWHSRLWHYSPPNTSDRRRIGVAAVWLSVADARKTKWSAKTFPWIMRGGQPGGFPFESFTRESSGSGEDSQAGNAY